MDREPLKIFIRQFTCLNLLEHDRFSALIVNSLHTTLEKQEVVLADIQPLHLSKAILDTVRHILTAAPTDYMLNLGCLDAGGLRRLGQMLYLSLEELQDQQGKDKPLLIKDYVMLDALTDSIRRLRIELTKDQIAVATDALEDVYRETGSRMPLCEGTEGVYQFRHRRAVNS
jgi:hypothetical protein